MTPRCRAGGAAGRAGPGRGPGRVAGLAGVRGLMAAAYLRCDPALPEWVWDAGTTEWVRGCSGKASCTAV